MCPPPRRRRARATPCAAATGSRGHEGRRRRGDRRAARRGGAREPRALHRRSARERDRLPIGRDQGGDHRAWPPREVAADPERALLRPPDSHHRRAGNRAVRDLREEEPAGRLVRRIADVRQYYVSLNGDEARARSRLTQIINSVLREEIGKRNVPDVVSGERDKIMQAVRDKVADDAKPFGVQIVDVRLKRVELPQEVSESVFRRMEAERRAVASQLRSQGASEAEKIRAEADKDREVIIAEAYRDAQRVKGEGDARAATIYAKAFSENPEFYSFYRSLEAYRSSFRSRGDVLVLEPSSEFFKYLRNPGIERRANPK